MFALLISWSSKFQQFIAASFPVSSAAWSVIPAVHSFFKIFPTTWEVVRLPIFCSPMLWKAIVCIHCCLYPGHLLICWCHIYTYTVSILRDLLIFPSVHELFWSQSLLGRVSHCHSVTRELLAFLEHLCSAGALALVQLGLLICAYLPYCLLLSCHVSPNYTVLDGCHQEEDKMYSTAWDGMERFYSCEGRLHPALLANV